MLVTSRPASLCVAIVQAGNILTPPPGYETRLLHTRKPVVRHSVVHSCPHSLDKEVAIEAAANNEMLTILQTHSLRNGILHKLDQLNCMD